MAAATACGATGRRAAPANKSSVARRIGARDRGWVGIRAGEAVGRRVKDKVGGAVRRVLLGAAGAARRG